MTTTHARNYSLAWLVWSSVLHHYLLFDTWPSVTIKISGFENSLITKYQMVTIRLYFRYLLVQLENLVVVLVVGRTSRTRFNYHLLLRYPCWLHYRRQRGFSNSSFWIFSMEHNATSLQAQWSPSHQVLKTGDVVELLLCDVGDRNQMTVYWLNV